MELCTARAVSNLPRSSPFTTSRARFQQFPSDAGVPNAYGLNFKLSGLRECSNLSLKVSYSDESSVGQYAKDGPDGVITFEDTRPVEKEEFREKEVSNAAAEEENASEENLLKLFESFLGKLDIEKVSNKAPKEDSSAENIGQLTEFLEKLDAKVSHEAPKEDSLEENLGQLTDFLKKFNLKLDSEDKYSLLVLGGGSLATLYLAAAVVGAIESIPLVPKLLQIVGLSYTIWFTSRYLVFKKTREELAAKIKDIKAQVLGSDDD